MSSPDSLLDLYKKVKSGTASKQEEIAFELRISTHSISRPFILEILDEKLKSDDFQKKPKTFLTRKFPKVLSRIARLNLSASD